MSEDSTQPKIPEIQSVNSILEQARQVSEDRAKLKAENDLLEQELARKETLRSQLIIAGKSVMAPPSVQETPEEKWRREAKLRYKGTGLDPT